MKITSVPALVSVPFADQGSKNVIPVASQIGITDGAASYTDGFPPLTMQPVAAGGIPPFGGDFNGILNAITQSLRWACAGGQYTYSSSFSTTIGGYPKGALLQNSSADVMWLNTTDDNQNDPATGTGWVPVIRYGKTTVSLAAANVTLTAEQAAKETIVLSGTLTANVSLIMPAWVETWLIINNTTGNFTLSVKTSAGSGVNLASGTTNQIYCDSTNIYYGALMAKNNLAEIKASGSNSQAAARTNLGLGTAATVDVQTSRDDVTVGRVLINGSAIAVRSFRASGGAGGNTTDANDLPANSVSFVYSSATNSPGFESSVLDFGGLDGSYNTQLAASYSTPGLIKFRTKNGDNDTWNVWDSFYTTGNKPTASDVGAYTKGESDDRYPLKDGATYVGFVSNNVDQPYLRHTASNTVVVLATTSYAYSKAESDGKYQLKNAAAGSTNGWFKDSATGIITQWGMTTSVSASQPITFPIAFPSICANVQVSAFTNGVAGTMETGCSAYSNVAATLTANQPFNLFWLATGY